MSYVYAGYGITVATLVLYAARLMVRDRALRARVGDERGQATP